MRLFLAINPPAEVQQELFEATAPMRVDAPDISWVPAPKIHLTLKFLGEQPDSAVQPLAEMLAGVAKSHAMPLVALQSVGAFPNFRRPRVVWMGVTPEPRLELLHHDVEIVCAAAGYELDGRPFRPHLTLGRVGEQGSLGNLRVLRVAAKKVRFTDEFFARSIDLMQSTPTPTGSMHTLLSAAPLRGS